MSDLPDEIYAVRKKLKSTWIDIRSIPLCPTGGAKYHHDRVHQALLAENKAMREALGVAREAMRLALNPGVAGRIIPDAESYSALQSGISKINQALGGGDGN